jgi:hypothetical protein
LTGKRPTGLSNQSYWEEMKAVWWKFLPREDSDAAFIL